MGHIDWADEPGDRSGGGMPQAGFRARPSCISVGAGRQYDWNSSPEGLSRSGFTVLRLPAVFPFRRYLCGAWRSCLAADVQWRAGIVDGLLAGRLARSRNAV